jgi:prophage regulatory protein
MRVLSIEDLRHVKGINYCPAHIRRLVRAGTLPAPIRLGTHRIGFLEHEIDAWLQAKAEERDAA